MAWGCFSRQLDDSSSSMLEIWPIGSPLSWMLIAFAVLVCLERRVFFKQLLHCEWGLQFQIRASLVNRWNEVPQSGQAAVVLDCSNLVGDWCRERFLWCLDVAGSRLALRYSERAATEDIGFALRAVSHVFTNVMMSVIGLVWIPGVLRASQRMSISATPLIGRRR